MAVSKRKEEMIKVSSLFNILATETRQCDTHGEYEAQKMSLPIGERWSDCPACMSERLRREDQAIAEQAMIERKRAQVEAMLGRAAIPKRFIDRTFENYQQDNEGQGKAWRAAKRYADDWADNVNRGSSLIMCGRPGTGKTHLAVAISRVVMDKGGSVYFGRLIDMTRQVMETYNRNSQKTAREVIQDLVKPDLLILDEVGHQRGTDEERLILFDVINARYEQCKPVILITNLDMAGLRQYLDERAEDRLREGGGRAIIFDWESYRARV